MKTTFLILISFMTALLLSPVPGAGEKVILKIPVRVVTESGPVKNLQKANFSLTINGQSRSILNCEMLSRSASKSLMPKNYVLKFNIATYGDNFKDVLTYFVNKIVKPADRLFLWTPVNTVYPVDPKLTKAKAIDFMAGKLKADTLKIKSQRAGATTQLVRYLNKLGAGRLSGQESETQASLTNIKQAIQNYLNEWNDFKQKFLLPDVRKYYSTSAALAGGNNHNIIIDFQQKNIMPNLSALNTAKRNIRNFLSGLQADERSWASSIESSLRVLEKSLLLTEDYPSSHIANAFLSGNMVYNVICFTNLKERDTGIDSESMDIGNILGKLAKMSGGCLRDTTDFNTGIKQILDKEDFYYTLAFAYDGQITDKKIALQLSGPKADLLYRELIPSREVQHQVETFSMPQVKIENFGCSGHRLKFSVSNFAIHKQKQMGFLDIRIMVMDQQGKPVFNTGNLLRSKQNLINIRGIPLPAKLSGKLKLKITILDMVSKKQVEKEADINL